MKGFVQIAWLGYFILLLCLKSNAQAPDLRFSHMSLSDGLANPSVKCLMEDQKGYLWIGTWDGLSRYDGYTFKNFQRQPDEPNSLLTNEIRSLLQRQDGRILVGSRYALSEYNPKTETFNHFSLSNKRSIYHAMIRDEAGNIWVGNERGPKLIKIDEEGCFTIFQKLRSIYSILDGPEGFWIGTYGRLYLFDPNEEKHYPIDQVFPNIPELSRIFKCLHQDQNGRIWIGTNKGLYCYDTYSQLFERVDESEGFQNPHINCILSDKIGRIWVGTNDGLHCLDANGCLLGIYQHDPQNAFSLSHNHITSLLEDRAGNLWIGTDRGGLNKCVLYQNNRFKAWPAIHFGYRFTDLIVFEISEGQDNRLWIGTNQGLFLLDKKTKAIQRRFQKGDPDTLGLAGGVVMSVFENEQNDVLIGYNSGGIDILNWEEQSMDQLEIRYYHSEKHPNAISRHTVRQIIPYYGKSDQYWIIGGEVLVFDQAQNRFSIIRIDSLDLIEKKIAGYSWQVYQIDSCSYIRLANDGIIYAQSCEENWIFTSLVDPKRVYTPQAVSLHPADDGTFWLGTYGNGLVQINADIQEIAHYGEKNGLSNNFIYGILEDGTGKLWMSTNKGISRFEPQTGRFTNYHSKDGIQAEEFASGAFLKAKDGEMFFGGENGFTSFYPDLIMDQTSHYQTPIHIERIHVSGGELERNDQQLEFTSYRGQYLELEFVGIDLTDPSRNLYQWQMEGWDANWSEPSLSRKAYFSNLPPGNYTFKVRASNSDGIFSDEYLSLDIRVRPRLDQSNWFRIGLPLLLIIGIGIGVYIAMQRLRQREKRSLEYRIARVRQEALASQMDQHFTFNTLNSIQRFISENDQRSAIYYISQFGKLMRRMLHQARNNYLSLEEEISTLEIYISLEALRAKQKFSYAFDIAAEVDIYNTEIPTGLLQPFIENSIWHGLVPKESKGKLWIRCYEQGEYLYLVVEDDGIGREKAQLLKAKSRLNHQSNGIAITKERIETLNSLNHWDIQLRVEDLKDSDGTARGTRVILSIPIHTRI